MIGKACEAGRSGPGARTMERMLPRDHLLRRVDRLLDLGALRPALAQHYSPRGRPSVDPELLIRMALVGRIYAIPSERRLCEELRYNLAYRWFCRLPAGAPVPHHSTFSKNRHGRFRDAGVFRLLFENTVRRCIAAGLVSTKDAAIDASFVAADASWQRKMRDDDLTGAAPPRPVRDWLADRDAGPDAPANPRRSVPAELSRTDPAAAWTSRTVRGRFGYALNVLIDTPSGVALDVEATPARFAAEVDAGRDMLARAAERFGYRPKRVAADTAYGSAAFLAFLRNRGTIAHIPVMERSEQATGKFPRAAFTYDRERDRYTCPAGKGLGHGGFDQRTEAHIYIARASDCQACLLRSQCTGGKLRRVTHSADEDVRDLARAEMQTELYKRSMRLRRGVERVFADAKTKRGLTRLHLRGIRGTEEEFQVAAAVSNLLLLARPDARAPRPGRVRAVHRRVSDMERVSRNRSAAPAMRGVAQLLSSATAA